MQHKLIGPFSQILTLRGLALNGPLADEQLECIADGGIVLGDGEIQDIDSYATLDKKYPEMEREIISEPMVLMPGMIDAHTHICYGGSREKDYALRVAGKSYLEIAKSGGGILSTVKHTREASEAALEADLKQRCDILLKQGVSTCEVKSGYGLSLEAELKMLRVIQKVNQQHALNLIPTCLAAHTKSPDFESVEAYTQYLVEEVLPQVKAEGLAQRVDIFVEDSAFDVASADKYLQAAQDMGFELTVHADQFTPIGSPLAVKYKALSADHLEASGEAEMDLLAASEVVGVLLPGCSMGLGIAYPQGRKMLDKGMCIAIASDWNPGSAPMGDLLLQAAVFGAYEKLSCAETFAAITFRAAKALNLNDRGRLDIGMKAHMMAFPTSDYRSILYQQGGLKPTLVWS